MNGDTLLFRQIHPSFVQAGRVTSQAFRPTPKDQNLLSVYDGDLISADSSWHHFTSQPNCLSVGVMAITVDECVAEQLSARPDPATYPEHALIDFTGLSPGQIEKKSKKLREKAEARGWQHRPTF